MSSESLSLPIAQIVVTNNATLDSITRNDVTTFWPISSGYAGQVLVADGDNNLLWGSGGGGGGGVFSITGTSNQVNVSTPTGNVVLNLPQNIGLTSSPTFANLTLSSLTNKLIYANDNNLLQGVELGTGLTFSNGLLSAIGNIVSITGTNNQVNVNNVNGNVTLSLQQDIGINSNVQFANLTLNSLENVLIYADNSGLLTNVFLGSGITFTNGVLSAIDNIVSITGTNNQVNVNNVDGNVTLSLPQSIALTSSPTFANLTLTSLNNKLLYANDSRVVSAVTVGSGLTFNAGLLSATGNIASITGTENQIYTTSSTGAVTLSLPQDIGLTSSPTFANLTLTSLLNKLLYTNDLRVVSAVTVGSGLTFSAGVLSATGGGGDISDIIGTSNQVNVNNVAGIVTLSLPQDINSTSSPTFANLTLTNLIDKLLYTNDSRVVSAVTIGSGLTFTNGLLSATGGGGSGVSSITGTANQINVNNVAGAVTLSLQQSIAITSDVQFAKILDSSIGTGNQIFGNNTMTDSTNVNTVAIGNMSLPLANNGSENTAVGYMSGPNMTTGYNNCFIGSTTGLGLQTGTSSNYIGAYAWASSSGVSYETAIGSGDGRGDNTMAFYAGNGFYFDGSIYVYGINISAFDNVLLYANDTGVVSPVTIGTGITFSAGILSSTGGSGVLSITGTSNQIDVSNVAGAVTLSLPQDIGLTSSPTFANLTLTNLTLTNLTLTNLTLTNLTNKLLYTNDSHVVSEVTIGSGLTFTNGLLSATGNIVSITGTANQINVNNVDGTVTLSLQQSIATTSNVQFAKILDSSIGTGNQIFGNNTMTDSTNVNTVAIGNNVLPIVNSSIDNVAVGFKSGNVITSGSFNCFIGSQAGIYLTTGSSNCFIGFGAGVDLITGDGCIYIGSGSNSFSSNVNYETVIGLGNGNGSNTATIYGSAGCYFNGVVYAPGVSISTLTLTSLTNKLLYTNDSSVVSAVTVGSGLSFNNGVLIATGGGGFSGVSSVTGTANQIIVSPASVGDVILSLPQNIGLTSSPTFANLTLTSLTDKLLYTNDSRVVSAVIVSTGLTFSNGVLSTVQNIGVTSSPTFANLTLTSLLNKLLYTNDSRVVSAVTIGTGMSFNNGLLSAIGNIVSITGTANQIDVSNVAGVVTLSLPSTLVIANLTLTSLTDKLLYTNDSHVVSAVTIGSGLTFTNGLLSATGNIVSITGTANQINVNNVDGTVTLSLPQNIGLTSSPTFANLTLTSLLNKLLYTNDSHVVSAVTIGTGMSFSNGVLSVTGGGGSGVSSVTGTANQINVNNVAGNVTLSLPQSIVTTSNVQFARILNSSIGTNNQIIGTNSLSGTLNNNNIAIGNNALNICSSSNFNIAIGSNAASTLQSGSFNCFIGGANSEFVTGNQCIYIGHNAKVGDNSARNQEIVIGSGRGNGSNTATIHASNGIYFNSILYVNNIIINNLGVDNLIYKDNTTGYLRAVVLGAGLTFGGNTLSNTGVTSIIGTGNQIIATNVLGAVTLRLPQDISTTSEVIFGSLKLTNVLSGLIAIDSNGLIRSVDTGAGLIYSNNTLSNTGILNIASANNQINVSNNESGTVTLSLTSSPTFANLTLTSTSITNRLLYANSIGVVTGVTVSTGLSFSNGILSATGGGGSILSISGTNNQINVLNNNGNIRLSTPQDIDLNASPSFQTLYITGYKGYMFYSDLTSGKVYPATIGTGLSFISATGRLSNTGITSITGTENQIYTTSSTGAVTLSLPQDINSTSSPTFAGLTLNSLLTNSLIYTNDTKNLSSVYIGSGLSFSNGVLSATGNIVSITGTSNQINVNNVAGVVTLSLPQDINSTSSPTFANLTLTSLIDKLLYTNNSSVVSAVAIGAGISFSNGLLSTVQDIGLTSSPTFANLTLSGLGAGLLRSSSSGVQGLVTIGTGISYNTITNTLSNVGVLSIVGTSGQVNVSNVAGVVTLSLPSTLVIANLTLTSLIDKLLYTNDSRVISAVTIGTGLIFSNGLLSTVQDIGLTSSPTFANLTLSGLGTGLLRSSSGVQGLVTIGTGISYNTITNTLSNVGVLSITGTANQINVNNVAGVVTLSLQQDIGLTSSPTFSNLTLSGLGTGLLRSSSGVQGLVTIGTGISYNTITNTLSNVGVLSITGTANQIDVSNVAGVVTLSLPSTLVIANLTLTSLIDKLLYTNDSHVVSAVTIGAGMSFSNGVLSATGAGSISSITGASNQIDVSNVAGAVTLSLPQDIGLTSSPTFANLTLSGLGAGLLRSSSSGAQGLVTIGTGISYNTITNTLSNVGVLSITGTANQIIATDYTGAITLRLPQSISGTSSPTFAGLTLTGFGDHIVYLNNAGVVSAVTTGTGVSFSNGLLSATGNIVSITGTANQINVSPIEGTGAVTISLPQSIATNSNVQFANLAISSMSNNISNGVSLGNNSGTSPGGVFIGNSAGNGGGQTTPNYSTSIGYLAGQYGGSYCVSIGAGAGYYMYGRNNICIGESSAGAGSNGGNNNIYIGCVQSNSGFTNNETVIGGSFNNAIFGKGSNTAYIVADNGCYFSGGIIASNARLTSTSLTNKLLYANDSGTVSAVTLDNSLTFTTGTLSVTNSIINLWNNNVAVVNNVEQWILNSASGIANIGSTPTITSGVITNMPVGVYEINIYGSIILSNNTHSYPQLQYKTNGGSFVTIGQTPLTSNGNTNAVAFSITSYVRISNVLDAIQLYYNPTAVYTNIGTDPIVYNNSYLPRYLSIKYVSA